MQYVTKNPNNSLIPSNFSIRPRQINHPTGTMNQPPTTQQPGIRLLMTTRPSINNNRLIQRQRIITNDHEQNQHNTMFNK